MLVERQVHITAGASGSGKSTIVSQTIRAWASGQPLIIPGLALPPGVQRVAWVAADRGDEVYRRLAGIPDSKVTIYSLLNDPTFHREWLRDGWLTYQHVLNRIVGPYQLVVLDPLQPFMTGSINAYRDVMLSLIDLGKDAVQRNLTLWGLHHASKARTDFSFVRPQDAIAGSTAFQGFSGTQMILVPSNDKTPYCQYHMVPHEGPPSSYKLTRTADGDFCLYTEEQPDAEASNPHSQVSVLDCIPPGTFSIAEIMAMTSPLKLSRPTLFRILEKLIAQGLLTKPKHGHYAKV